MPVNTIGAFYYNTMFIHMHEFLVKQEIPHSMHELTVAVSEDVVTRTEPCKIKEDVIERIR